MTWRAIWDIDHWPGHDYRDCATEREAEAVGVEVAATAGQTVTIFEIEGDDMTGNADSEPVSADLRRLGGSGVPVEGREAERGLEGEALR